MKTRKAQPQPHPPSSGVSAAPPAERGRWAVPAPSPGSHGDPASELPELSECLSMPSSACSCQTACGHCCHSSLSAFEWQGALLRVHPTLALQAQPGGGSLSIHLQDRQAGWGASAQRRGWCPPPAGVQEAGRGCHFEVPLSAFPPGSGAVSVARRTPSPGGRQGFSRGAFPNPQTLSREGKVGQQQTDSAA